MRTETGDRRRFDPPVKFTQRHRRALVLFLTSGAGAKISGQALPVDGHTEGLSSGADTSSDPSGE